MKTTKKDMNNEEAIINLGRMLIEARKTVMLTKEFKNRRFRGKGKGRFKGRVYMNFNENSEIIVDENAFFMRTTQEEQHKVFQR